MKERTIFISSIIILLIIQILLIFSLKKQTNKVSVEKNAVEFAFFNQMSRLSVFSVDNDAKFLYDQKGQKYPVKSYFNAHLNALFIREVPNACDICIIETLKQLSALNSIKPVIIISDTTRQAINLSKSKYGSDITILGCTDLSERLDHGAMSYCFKVDKDLHSRMIFFPSYYQPQLISGYLSRIKN